MRSLLRAVVMAGATGALMLWTAPNSGAAPSVAAACVTAGGAETYGRGEISLCPLSDGSTHVTGYVEDLLPGGGWGAPDGYCVAWYLDMGAMDGTVGPMVCPHFGGGTQVREEFDFVATYPLPVTGAHLFRAGV
ncbi:hypothetical protein [Streptomyces tauricus]|uniref:hypothetical protein n=1 Tax=Streptomyces tauricus TaxID=68274 RepID=UPI002242DF74|nr:hypothetical protein [Streptomyces tauricus]MCW8102745.1 hypothetical protein [Streptomyces tauricus]